MPPLPELLKALSLPCTVKFITTHGLDDLVGNNVSIIKLVGYIDFLKLEQNAAKILTDFSGIQKEAYFLKVLCITLRENTERLETVDVGANRDRIVDAARSILSRRDARGRHSGMGMPAGR